MSKFDEIKNKEGLCVNCNIPLDVCKSCHSEKGNWYCSKKCYEEFIEKRGEISHE